MNYGKFIKRLRVLMKQTQSEFSFGIGTTQTYLSQIESGKKKPSPDMLERISKHVGIDMPILFMYASDESDIREDKREAFKLLKPILDALLESLFDKED